MPVMPMSQKKKPIAAVANCIFCGRPADSPEDAFPRWLTRRYPQEPGPLEVQNAVGGQTEIMEFGTLKVIIKCVRRHCNNEWMSEIQNHHGRPVITRLLDEPSLTLDHHECRSLALWGVMTSMVPEAINPPEHHRFTELERCLFWKERRIPQNTYIWIGKWYGSPGPSYVGHLLSKDGSAHRAVVNTIGFATLVIQVMKLVSSVFPKARPGEWDRALLPVWPPRGPTLDYPPHLAISGELGIEEAELRFSPPGADSGKPSEEVIRRSIGQRSRRRRRDSDMEIIRGEGYCWDEPRWRDGDWMIVHRT